MDILGSETLQQQQQPFGATPVLSRCRASMSSLLLLSLPGTNGKRGETTQAVLSMVSSSSFSCSSNMYEHMKKGMVCNVPTDMPCLNYWRGWMCPGSHQTIRGRTTTLERWYEVCTYRACCCCCCSTYMSRPDDTHTLTLAVMNPDRKITLVPC